MKGFLLSASVLVLLAAPAMADSSVNTTTPDGSTSTKTKVIEQEKH
jgi:hypothetical protein